MNNQQSTERSSGIVPLNGTVHVYPPRPDAVNVYQQRVATALEAIGLQVKPLTMESMLQTPGKRFERVVINWPELRVLGARGRISPIRWAYVSAWLRWIQSRSDQVTFVLHNYYAHDTDGLTRQATRALVASARKRSDRVLVHAPTLDGWDSRHHYVPHPLYPTVTAESSEQIEAAAGNLGDTYLVFGVIAEYKQLHRLLEAWPSGVRLLLAGSAPNAEYVQRLHALIKQRQLGDSVRIIPAFVSEAQAAFLLQNCKATLLLHDSAEMIASGSFFHAISYGATVLGRARSFYSDIRSEFTQFHTFDDLDALATMVESGAVERLASSDIRDAADRAFGTDALNTALRNALR